MAVAGVVLFVASSIFEMQDIVVEDFSTDGLILDIGGGGEGIIGRMKTTRDVAIDISRGELANAPVGPLKVVMDATDLKFLDGSFPTATSSLHPDVHSRGWSAEGVSGSLPDARPRRAISRPGCQHPNPARPVGRHGHVSVPVPPPRRPDRHHRLWRALASAEPRSGVLPETRPEHRLYSRHPVKQQAIIHFKLEKP